MFSSTIFELRLRDVKFYHFLFLFPFSNVSRSLEDFNFTQEARDAWNFKLFRYTWKNDGRWDILMKEGVDSIYTRHASDLIYQILGVSVKLKCRIQNSNGIPRSRDLKFYLFLFLFLQIGMFFESLENLFNFYLERCTNFRFISIK